MKLSPAMVKLLRQMGEGRKVSIYKGPPGSMDHPWSPYWASISEPLNPPKLGTVLGLQNRGLIEHYDDAASITEAGRRWLAVHPEESIPA